MDRARVVVHVVALPRGPHSPRCVALTPPPEVSMHHDHDARAASPAYDLAREDCVTRTAAAVTRASRGAPGAASDYDVRRDRDPDDLGVHGASRPLGRAPLAAV